MEATKRNNDRRARRARARTRRPAWLRAYIAGRIIDANVAAAVGQKMEAARLRASLADLFFAQSERLRITSVDLGPIYRKAFKKMRVRPA